jgi:hypothetical protein
MEINKEEHTLSNKKQLPQRSVIDKNIAFDNFSNLMGLLQTQYYLDNNMVREAEDLTKSGIQSEIDKAINAFKKFNPDVTDAEIKAFLEMAKKTLGEFAKMDVPNRGL